MHRSRYHSLLLATALLAISACAIQSSNYRSSAGKPVPSIRLYATPEAALQAFKAAMKSENTERVVEILGEEGSNFIISGDPTADAIAMRRFSARLEQRAEVFPVLSEEHANEQWYKLRFGAEGWNMRIPLVNRGSGWFFETYYAKDAVEEMRRELNEVDAIDTLQEIIKAQGEYFRVDRDGDGVQEYAQTILSSPEKYDGLYWKPGSIEESPLAQLVAAAVEAGYKKSPDGTPAPFGGYVYSILRAQAGRASGGSRNYMAGENMTGGFAVLAYPIVWNRSGGKTFVATRDGKIWKKDLGFKTDSIASTMKTFNPDWTWTIVDLK